MPALAVAAAAALAFTTLTGHGPRVGPLAANQQGGQPGPGGAAQPRLGIGAYPGQQQRGVYQTIGRIVASGNTIVATGAQASDGITRQQFFTSTDGGTRWQLGTLHGPGGTGAPAGYAAARLAGSARGWLAIGSQATWTSPDGLSWTLAKARGIAPQEPGDQVLLLNSTPQGYLAAGLGQSPGGGSQAVIWTSGDGLTWQRHTAAQLGLASPGESVLDISYATAQGNATVITGTVARDGATYSGVWQSADGGAAWQRVTVPAGHGAGTTVTGLGFDQSGLIAVRTGRTAGGSADGVAYFSPDGRTWKYAATIDPTGGWTPSLVKGSAHGFVTVGTSAGQIIAYASTGGGTTWEPAAPLGAAATDMVSGATVGAGGAVIAIGSAAPRKAGQAALFVRADTAGQLQQVPLARIPGAVVPELAVNDQAVYGGVRVAVGSADGYPAIWRQVNGGSWTLVSSPPTAPPGQGLGALTSVTHGSSGWLAVGAPGPFVLTSADGRTWQPANGPGAVIAGLAGVSAVAAAAGPAGYVIVGKLVAAGGACVADVWWSPDLITWARGSDVNDTAGSSQVLAVTATARGFISAGSHDGQPAVWTTADGRSWRTVVLPLPAGATGAVLQQVAASGSLVAAVGQETTPGGTVPFAELSADGGTSWRQVPFARKAAPGAAFTGLAATASGFTAVSQAGTQVQAWTAAGGTSWSAAAISGLPAGTYRVAGLAGAGPAVTGVATAARPQSQQAGLVTIPAG